ncbi:hypothetical protein JCM10212_002546 [Sporobolomyces blumeae]
MATPSTSAPPAAAVPTPPTAPEEQALLLFARSTLDLFHVWPALRLAISHGWGNSQGRTHLAEDIVDLFYSTATTTPEGGGAAGSGSTSMSEGGVRIPAIDEVEETLKWGISQQFDVDLEDGSELTISKDLIALWRECLRIVQASQGGASGAPPLEEGPLAKKFREGADKAKREDGQGRFVAQRAPGQDGDEDEDTTDDEDYDEDGFETEEDDEMNGGHSHAEPGPSRERAEPVIDEDGFEMVQPKKKGGRR